MRLRNIEFTYSKGNRAWELVKWNGETCFVIAFFDRHKEGYAMRTVGGRFFEDHDAWFVGKHALMFLNEVLAEQEL